MLASVALLAGVVSHALADGRLPGALALTLLWGSCLLGSALLLMVRASAPRIVVMLLAGQTWVHGVLSATAGHRGEVAEQFPPLAPASLGAPTGGGSLLERFRASTDAANTYAPDDWIPHQVDHLTAQGPFMLLAHVGAAAAIGLFLAVGEDALWRLLALAAVRADARARYALRRASVLAAACGTRARRPLHTEGPQTFDSQVLATGVDRGRAPPFVLAA